VESRKVYLFDAEEQLVGVSLRPVRLLLDLHRVIVVAVVIVVVVVIAIGIGVWVALLWLAMLLLLRYIHPRRRLGRACGVIEIDDLVAVVETIVGFGRWRLALCCADGGRFELLQRVRGQVVQVVVGKIEVVILVHGRRAIPPCARNSSRARSRSLV
jgi:MFS superfamily sulfate permease-like transporter